MWVETCNTNREPSLVNLDTGINIFIGATATPDEFTVERTAGDGFPITVFKGSEELAHRVYYNIAWQLGALKIMPHTGGVRKFNLDDKPGVGVYGDNGQKVGVM